MELIVSCICESVYYIQGVYLAFHIIFILSIIIYLLYFKIYYMQIRCAEVDWAGQGGHFTEDWQSRIGDDHEHEGDLEDDLVADEENGDDDEDDDEDDLGQYFYEK